MKTESVHLRLPSELVARVKRLAKEEGRTLANMMQRLIILELNRRTKENEHAED
jgi:predicted DNA-binding protein